MTNDPDAWEPPGWFWELLGGSDHTLQVLAGKLEALSADQLRAFQECFEDAKGYIHPVYRDDLNVLEGIAVECSEDHGDDFADWVVSQGRVFYEEVKTKPELINQFLEMFRQFDYEDQYPEMRWNSDVVREEYRGYQSPGFIGYAVYEQRFKKSLYDELDLG